MDILQGGRGALGAVVKAKDDQKVAECYVKRYFGSGKGAAFVIHQAWREQRRRQVRRGFRRWGRE